MPQKSMIEQLPDEVRLACDRILLQPGITLEKAIPLLEAIGVRVSMSAAGRHRRKIEELADYVRKGRMITQAIGQDLADAPEDRLSALNMELLQNQLFKLLSQAGDDDGEIEGITAKDARCYADALYRLEAAAKIATDRLLKIREETADKTIAAANVELKKSGQPGLSKETVEGIRHAVLGVSG